MAAEPATEKKPEKIVKPRIEPITVAHIVDCWKMLDRSIKDTHPGYPDLTEESPERIRAYLFQFISSPSFVGMIAKVGKRPVGHILGRIQLRPFGKPERFCFIWTVWIEPEYRKRGLMKTLSESYFVQLKQYGVHHWEAEAPEELALTLKDFKGFEVKNHAILIGGKLK